jgi:outer membrane immunogenic protein
MKKILLSTIALVGLTAGAMAADLPARVAPPPPVAAVPVFTWSGFYVGVNGGVAFQDEDDDRPRKRHYGGYGGYDGWGNRGGRGGRGDDTSILGGGQIGYNMQFGMFVAGVEADIQAIDFERINPALNPNRNRINGRDNDDEVDLFGTVRGRLGLAAFDRALIYATGGLAWKTDEDSNGRLRRNGSDDIGFTVGGGVEWAFTNNLSLKVEGLYVDFSDDNNGRNRRNNNVRASFDESREFGLVRAGLNFRFNSF